MWCKIQFSVILINNLWRYFFGILQKACPKWPFVVKFIYTEYVCACVCVSATSHVFTPPPKGGRSNKPLFLTGGPRRISMIWSDFFISKHGRFKFTSSFLVACEYDSLSCNSCSLMRRIHWSHSPWLAQWNVTLANRHRCCLDLRT